MQYLYLFTCGEHSDARLTAAGVDGEPWVEWAVMDEDDSESATFQKRWAWTEEGDAATR